MGRNAKARRERKEAQRNTAITTVSTPPIDFDQAFSDLEILLDPSKLTVPTKVNEDVASFCSTISDAEPFFIDVEPEPWSKAVVL